MVLHGTFSRRAERRTPPRERGFERAEVIDGVFDFDFEHGLVICDSSLCLPLV